MQLALLPGKETQRPALRDPVKVTRRALRDPVKGTRRAFRDPVMGTCRLIEPLWSKRLGRRPQIEHCR